MRMAMMHVVAVGVAMRLRFVAMRVRVLADHGLRVDVIVMAVVVSMGVLVLELFVRMRVSMLLGEMKMDAEREKHGRENGAGARLPSPECE